MAFLSSVHFLTGSHCKLRPNTEGSALGIHYYCGLNGEEQVDMSFAPNKPTPAVFAAGKMGKERMIGSAELKEATKARKMATAPGLKPVFDWVVRCS
jgi:hypothetical protein